MGTVLARSSTPRSRGGGINAHLYPSVLLHEARMERICRAIVRLGSFACVEMIGVQEESLPVTEVEEGVFVRRLPRRDWGGPRTFRKAVQTLDWSRRVLGMLRHEDVRCVNSHSLAVLPLGVALKFLHRARLVYDTHELETEVSSARGARRWLYKLMEWVFIRWADDVYVVSDSIADWYAHTYRIVRPVVVRNVPDVRAGSPSPDQRLWRARFGIPAEHLVFIYQGGLGPGRRIEQLLRVFTQAQPDRHVVFMGYGALEEMVRTAAATRPNIHYASAVPPADVLRHTAGADVGLVGVENVCLSYYYSLPNKLMEYLLAGLPALMPNYPEMRKVVETTGCGWTVGESDSDWIAAVNRLDWATTSAAQARARTAAGSFSWQEEEEKLRNGYTIAFPRAAA
jgi:glycosyltransferase involved in cell wall biosynthesis